MPRILQERGIQRILEDSDGGSVISELESDYVYAEELDEDEQEETIEEIEHFVNISAERQILLGDSMVIDANIQSRQEPLQHGLDEEGELPREVFDKPIDVIPEPEDEDMNERVSPLLQVLPPTRSRSRNTRSRRVSIPLADNWSVEVRDLERVVFSGRDNQIKQSEIFDENTSVFTIFRSIISDEVIALMVQQTNLYGQRLKQQAELPHSRIKRWHDVNEEEMLRFLGVCLLTGLVSFPTLESYWKKDILYQHPLLHQMGMSYNRFNLILRCWHFADNLQEREIADSIYKIRPLLDLIINNVRKIYTPGETLVVDESMVHFRGRLHFRQYIPSKTHKYGVKIYKLCTPDGYTLGYKIYSGESQQVNGLDTSGSIVIQLAEDFLDEGKLVVTDNYYTSIPLAEYLKSRNTDLLGTVNKKRRGLSKEVVQAKLMAGEVAVMQKNNMTLLKWHDKRDVTMLSTCHSKELAMSCGRNPRQKPRMILDYNVGKKGIDVADQLASYNSPIRKTVIWYKKIAADLLSIAIVNSVVIFNEFHPRKKERCSILSAYEQIIKTLLGVSTESSQNIPQPGPSGSTPTTPPRVAVPSFSQHFLVDLPKIPGKRPQRKRCTGCYKRLIAEGKSANVARNKATRVHQQCKTCKVGYCYHCFEIYHK